MKTFTRLTLALALPVVLALGACKEPSPATEATSTADDQADQGMDTSMTQPAPEPSREDLAFFEKAAQSGMLEMQAAELASTRASAIETKNLASTLDTAHRTSSAELETLALSKGVTLPTQLDSDHQGVLDNLMKAEAEDFDAAYVEAMTDRHEDAVALFESTSTGSDDAEIRNYAARALPTLQRHLEVARQMEASS